MPGIEKPIDLNAIKDKLRATVIGQAQEGLSGGVDVDVTLHPRLDEQALAAAEQALAPTVAPLAPPVPPALPPVPSAGPGWVDPAAAVAAEMVEREKRFRHVDPSPAPGAYPSPHRTPEEAREGKAHDLWHGIRDKGTLFSIREMQGGKFDPWMDYLQGSAKDEAAEIARASRRKEGHGLVGAAEEMEAAGRRIYDLMREIEAAGRGTPQAEKAANEIAKLTRRIEHLGESAKAGADAIGGEAGTAARAEIEERLKAAKAGLAPGPDDVPDSPRGNRFSPWELRRMAEDPLGAAQGMASEAVWSRLAAAAAAPRIFGAGGAFAAMGGGVGAGLALGAGSAAALYGGFQVPGLVAGWATNGWDQDYANVEKAYRHSAIMGRRFDIRGDLGDVDSRKNIDLKLSDINRENVYRASAAMGVSFAGTAMEADEGSRNKFYRFLDQGVARRNKDFGLADGTLESVLGEMIRSGSVRRDQNDMGRAVERIGTLLEKANEIGIGTQEAIAAIGASQALVQGRMGFVSADSSKYMASFQAFLQGSGWAALRGQEGVKVAGESVDNMPIESKAQLYSQLISNPKLLESEGIAAFDEEQWKALKKSSKGDTQLLALQVAESPTAKLRFQNRMLNSDWEGLDSFNQHMLMGLDPKKAQNSLYIQRVKAASPAELAKMATDGGRPVTPEEQAKKDEMKVYDDVAAKMTALAQGIDKVQMSAIELEKWVNTTLKQAHAGAFGREKAANAFANTSYTDLVKFSNPALIALHALKNGPDSIFGNQK